MAFTFQQRGAGLFFKLEVEGETQVSAALTGIIKRIKDLRPLADPINWILSAAVSDAFEKEGSGRQKWADLSELTVKGRVRRGFPGEHPILVNTGRLKQSLLSKGHSEHILDRHRDYIEYGTKVPYAIYHQSPDESRDKLPRRAMIYLKANPDFRRIVQAFRQYIKDNKIYRR